MDLSMCIIDDDLELVRILESMNLDKYELIDLFVEQSDDLSRKHTGIGMAPSHFGYRKYVGAGTS